jgi:Co/Zn/Cd efflux system component
MGCEYTEVEAKTEGKRRILRTALVLNAGMFVIGTAAGLWAQSTGVLADALDMLTDAIAYWLALMAFSRGLAFKRLAARWSGWILVVLGAGILTEVGRKYFFGSEPIGSVMMVYSGASFGVNLYVLSRLAAFRHGEVHLRATYLFTRADVVANVALFVSGGIVAATGLQVVDLLLGFGIGLFVLREAVEILRQANEAGETAKSVAKNFPASGGRFP